jgi:hypothetical protein
MAQWFAMVAQIPDEGEGGAWKYLIYLVIFIVLPLLNAIKDAFVKRAEKKREEAARESLSLPTPPKMEPVEPKLPTAKALRPQRDARPASRVETASPARPSPRAEPRRRPQADVVPRPRPAQAPRAEAPPRAAPRPVPPPPRPQPPRGPVKQPARPAAKVSHVAGVDVHAADPTIDVHGADPRIRTREEAAAIKDKPTQPRVKVHDLVTTGEAVGLPAGADLVAGAVSAVELRRAVVMSEILRPPVALRGRGWLPPPLL